MFVTMVEGRVDDARQVICAQIGTSGPRVTSPPVSSSPIWCTLMTECGGSWQPSRSSSKPAPDPRSRCGQMKVGPVWGNTAHREPAPRGEP